MKRSVGIVGLATYLPPDVRANDWWSEEIVARWGRNSAAPLTERANIVADTAAARVVEEAMRTSARDPFHGARERRVLNAETPASVMELEAARRAIANAAIDPEEIGLVLCNTVVPDYLVTNNACLLHHNLALSPRCMTMATEAAANAFLSHVALAESLIASGSVRYALLVQTCNITPVIAAEDPVSAWFGDACAATVLGLVPDGTGILAHAHRTRGEYHRALVGGVPGKRWHDDGAFRIYPEDHEAARRSFLSIAAFAEEVTAEVFRESGHTAADVDFYAPHQPTSWFRDVTKAYLGLSEARSVETFRWAGSVFGANIPLGIETGVREGALRKGDLVLMHAGGVGLTYSSMLMRWS